MHCSQVFKRLFPPDLFAAFIDVGHYTPALTAYSDLVTRFEGIRGKLVRCIAVTLFGGILVLWMELHAGERSYFTVGDVDAVEGR